MLRIVWYMIKEMGEKRFPRFSVLKEEKVSVLGYNLKLLVEVFGDKSLGIENKNGLFLNNIEDKRAAVECLL